MLTLEIIHDSKAPKMISESSFLVDISILRLNMANVLALADLAKWVVDGGAPPGARYLRCIAPIDKMASCNASHASDDPRGTENAIGACHSIQGFVGGTSRATILRTVSLM
jgi:hypothetical protein